MRGSCSCVAELRLVQVTVEVHCATGVKGAGRGGAFVAVRCVDQATLMPQEEDEEGSASPAQPRTAKSGDGGGACSCER